MFISFFTGKVMLFYGISLIMKEKSNASALADAPTGSERSKSSLNIVIILCLMSLVKLCVNHEANVNNYSIVSLLALTFFASRFLSSVVSMIIGTSTVAFSCHLL